MSHVIFGYTENRFSLQVQRLNPMCLYQKQVKDFFFFSFWIHLSIWFPFQAASIWKVFFFQNNLFIFVFISFLQSFSIRVRFFVNRFENLGEKTKEPMASMYLHSFVGHLCIECGEIENVCLLTTEITATAPATIAAIQSMSFMHIIIFGILFHSFQTWVRLHLNKFHAEWSVEAETTKNVRRAKEVRKPLKQLTPTFQADCNWIRQNTVTPAKKYNEKK